MSGQQIVVVVIALAGFVCLVTALSIRYMSPKPPIWRALLLLSTFVLVLFSLIAVIRHVVNTVDRHNCYAWGDETDREVRYIEVGYFDFGCYALVDGQWIKRGNLIAITGER